MSCNSERTYEILDIFALLLVRELFGGSTDDLINYLDRAARLVNARNGKRNSLAVIVHSEYDKLTGLCLVSHKGCLYPQLDHRRIKNLFFKYFVHKGSPIDKLDNNIILLTADNFNRKS